MCILFYFYDSIVHTYIKKIGPIAVFLTTFFIKNCILLD